MPLAFRSSPTSAQRSPRGLASYNRDSRAVGGRPLGNRRCTGGRGSGAGHAQCPGRSCARSPVAERARLLPPRFRCRGRPAPGQQPLHRGAKDQAPGTLSARADPVRAGPGAPADPGSAWTGAAPRQARATPRASPLKRATTASRRPGQRPGFRTSSTSSTRAVPAVTRQRTSAPCRRMP